MTTEHAKALSPGDKHLRTDHLLSNLEGVAISSGMVTFMSQGAQFALNLGGIMILARVLNPADFGLVAMLTTVMGFLRVFREVGLSTATIQREGITHGQVSNLFWINVSVGTAAGIVLAAASPLIAWFYREPRLVPVTLCLAATFPLSGLTVQHNALLSRQMRFAALAFVQVGSQLVSFSTGIGMALLGYGYWALVGMNVAAAVTTVLFTFIAVPWRPQGPSRGNGTRPLLSFGANLVTNGFILSLAKGSDSLAIGRMHGPNAIGLYSRAGALFSRPLEQVLGAAESVFVPMLSRVQNDPERYRTTFLSFFQSMALASCLANGVLLPLSRPITLLILGDKWEDAALIFAGFCLSAMCAPTVSAASWLLTSQGRGDEILRGGSIISLSFVLSVLMGLPFGPAGVAVSTSAIGVLVGTPLMYYFAGRRGPVTTSDLLRALLRCLPLWGFVLGITFLVYRFLGDVAPVVQIAVCGAAGLIAGGLFISISPPLRRTALEILRTARSVLYSGRKTAAAG